MASVGCSPLSETDTANDAVVAKRRQLKQQRDQLRQQEFQQGKRCAARWLRLVQGVLRQDIVRKLADARTPLARRFIMLARRSALCCGGHGRTGRSL